MLTAKKTARLKCGAKAGVLRRDPRRKLITANYLQSMGACHTKVQHFESLFPKGMPLTRENLLVCALNSLFMSWVRIHLLKPEVAEAIENSFDKARIRYKRRNDRIAERQRAKEIDNAKADELWVRSNRRHYKDVVNVIADVLGLK